MSDKEKKREQSIRLFEALSGISPELLARSEKKAESKVIRPWGGRFGRYIAACLAVLLVGGTSLYAMKFSGSWKGADNAALQNGASGGASNFIRQGSVAEQITEQIEADRPEEAAADELYLYSPNVQQGTQAVSEGEGQEENRTPTEQQSSMDGTAEHGKNSLLSDESKKEIESGIRQEGSDSKEGFSAEMSVQNAAGYLTEEDVARMGSLAAYAPVSLPQGYAVSDTRIAVDESGVGNYVIVIRSEEGNVLEYRVSRGEEDNADEVEISGDGKENNVIYVTDLNDEKIGAELTKVKQDNQDGTVVAMLYGDGVRVEVRGDYTLEILREICPEE